MKPCYGCKETANGCAGRCRKYHEWVNGLKDDPEAMKRQRREDDFLLHRDIWRHYV